MLTIQKKYSDDIITRYDQTEISYSACALENMTNQCALKMRLSVEQSNLSIEI